MKFSVKQQADRLLSRAVETRGGCLECSCHKSRGYGQARVSGEWIYAHRIIWEAAFGKIPDGTKVLHNCDNRACININHLHLGTQKQNMIEKFQRSRGANQVLDPSKVTEIRRLYKNGALYQYEIAGMFNIERSSISRIINGERWSHVI